MPYPDQLPLIADLIQDHIALEDEPLLIAVYYASNQAPNEECLFEVAQNFGFNEISDDREIMQIQFGRSAGFPLPPDAHLRLLLTNLVELRQSASEHWPQVEDLRGAISAGNFTLLYQRHANAEAQEALDLLELQPVAA